MKRIVNTRYFRYDQNMMEGKYEEPAETVYIEAIDAAHADYIAENFTPIYLNGVDRGLDCPSGSDKWEEADPQNSLDYRPTGVESHLVKIYDLEETQPGLFSKVL